MKKITLKKITIIFIVLILIQFFVILLTDESDKYELEKASEELKYDFQYSQKSIDERVKILYIKQLKNRMIAANLRGLNDEDKVMCRDYLNRKIEEFATTNPSKSIESKHQLEILDAGYNPISYFMEKILSLKSLDFLTYQKNYFF